MTLKLGLTGGIGSGKSTVSAMLLKLGATVIDTDAISRALTMAQGQAMPHLVQAFGPALLTTDGAMDRGKMRDLVFANPDAKLRLEAILHPLIGQETQRRAAAAEAAKARCVVFDVPLLAESKTWRERVEAVLVVDCLEATQITRVSQRPGWSPAAAQQVVAQQASRAKRRAIADAVIFNDGISLADLDLQVQVLWSHWVTQPPKKH